MRTAHASITKPARPTVRSGFTLIELLLVIVIAGVLLGLLTSRISSYAARLAVRGAIGDAESIFASGRELALTRRAYIAIVIDTARGDLRLLDRGALVGSRKLRAVYGVRLSSTRDSMTYDPRGLGFGIANLRLVAVRGSESDTLYVSRLGRVRRAGAF
jgi:prepilin-type N-terminal cleavage/methylation domain-containing protein